MLSLHNRERTSLGLISVVWNQDLQSSAQSWSNSLARNGCRLEHFLSSFAQNLYGIYGTANFNTTMLFINAVQAWLDEKRLLNVPGVSWEQVGHYLIMTDTNVRQVGCAVATNAAQRCAVVTCDYDF